MSFFENKYKIYKISYYLVKLVFIIQSNITLLTLSETYSKPETYTSNLWEELKTILIISLKRSKK